MTEYILDGEIRSISKYYAAAIIKVNEIKLDENNQKFHSIRNGLYEKYAQYLYSFNKEKVHEIIMDYLNSFSFNTPEDFSLIYRPSLEKYKEDGTLAIKFKRAEKDNLDSNDIL